MTSDQREKVEVAMKRAPNAKTGTNEKRVVDDKSKNVVDLVARSTPQPVALELYPY